MANFFDRFDQPSQGGNFFDQFDQSRPQRRKISDRLVDALQQRQAQPTPAPVVQMPQGAMGATMAQERPQFEVQTPAQGIEQPTLTTDQGPTFEQRQQDEAQMRQALRTISPQADEGFAQAGINMAKNYPGDLVNIGKQIVQMVSSPIQTTKSLAKVAAGLAQLMVPGEDGYEEYARDIGRMLKKEYGSVEATRKTMQEQPAKFAMDIAGAMTGVGTVGKALSKTGRFTTLADDLMKTAIAAEGMGPVITPLKVAAKVAKKPLAAASKRIVNTAMTATPTQVARLSKMAKKDIGEWVAERGIAGSLPKMADDLWEMHKQSRDAVNRSLASIPERVKPPMAQALIDRLRKLTKKADSKKSRKIRDLVETYDEALATEGLTLSEANNIKRIVDKHFNQYDPTGSHKKAWASNDMANLRDELQVFIEDAASSRGITNIRELNNQSQVARGTSTALRQSAQRASKNRILSLTDWIWGGQLFRINPAAAAAGVTAKKVMESPAILTQTAKALRKLSDNEITAIERALIDQSLYGKGAKSALMKVGFQLSRAGVPVSLRAIADADDLDDDVDYGE